MPANRSISSQFFSGTVAIGTARASTIVLGVISMMITVRHTAAEEYGVYVLIIVITSFMAEFMSFGMTLGIPKYLASSHDEAYKQNLNNTALNFRLVTALVFSILIFASRPLLSYLFDSPQFFTLFNYVPVLFGLNSLALLFGSILRGQFNFAALGMIEFITNAIELICLGLMLLVFHLGLPSLFFAKFVSCGLYILLGYPQIRFCHKLTVDLSILKELVRFGFPLQMQFVLDFSFSRMDTLIIGSLLGTSGIAYYEIARRIPDSMMQLYSVFVSVYFPISANLYASEAKEKTEDLMNNSVRLLTFLTIFSALGAVVFGKEIISLLFSDAYLPSYLAFVILMLGFTLKVFENTLGYSLVAIGDPTKPLIVNIVRAFLSLVGNFIFLPIAGFLGAALVSVISNLFVIPLDAFFLWKRKLNTQFAQYLKPAAIFSVFSILFIGFGVTSIALKLFVFLLYFPACLGFSVITTHDLVLLYRETQLAIRRVFKALELPSEP